MTNIVTQVFDGDVQGALLRMKKGMLKFGVFKELRKREGYDKPSVKKRKKHIEAQKRQRKAVRRERERDLEQARRDGAL